MNKTEWIQVVFIVVTVIGWGAAFFFGIWQQRKIMKEKLKLEVYKNIYELKRSMDECAIEFSVLVSEYNLPFIQMRLPLLKNDPIQQNFEALKIWSDYVMKVNESKSRFIKAYLRLWNYFDMWICIMPKLKEMKEILFIDRMKILTMELNEYSAYIQNLSFKQHEWSKWDIVEIEKETKKMNEIFGRETSFFDDFMTEVHNELIGLSFKVKKQHREDFVNLPDRYEILTRDGLKIVKK